jgi:hypothetical protein
MSAYLLKIGSPVRLRALKVFEPLMLITGIGTPFATIPSITKLYFTHTQHASGLSLSPMQGEDKAKLAGCHPQTAKPTCIPEPKLHKTRELGDAARNC